MKLNEIQSKGALRLSDIVDTRGLQEIKKDIHSMDRLDPGADYYEDLERYYSQSMNHHRLLYRLQLDFEDDLNQLLRHRSGFLDRLFNEDAQLNEVSSTEMHDLRDLLRKNYDLNTFPLEDINTTDGKILRVSIDNPSPDAINDTDASAEEQYIAKQMRLLGHRATEVKFSPTEISVRLSR